MGDTYRQSVGLLLVVVKDVPEVDGHDDPVAEQERRVANLVHAGLDLAQGGQTPEV